MDYIAEMLFVWFFFCLVIGKEDYEEPTDKDCEANCWRQSTQGSDQIKQKQGIS